MTAEDVDWQYVQDLHTELVILEQCKSNAIKAKFDEIDIKILSDNLNRKQEEVNKELLEYVNKYSTKKSDLESYEVYKSRISNGLIRNSTEISEKFLSKYTLNDVIGSCMFGTIDILTKGMNYTYIK